MLVLVRCLVLKFDHFGLYFGLKCLLILGLMCFGVFVVGLDQSFVILDDFGIWV